MIQVFTRGDTTGRLTPVFPSLQYPGSLAFWWKKKAQSTERGEFGACSRTLGEALLDQWVEYNTKSAFQQQLQGSDGCRGGGSTGERPEDAWTDLHPVLR